MAQMQKPIRTAKQLMSANIYYIDGMATAKEAAAQMRQYKVESLIVKKRNEHDAFGVIAVQDLITGVVIPNRSPDEVNVFEIMTKPVITVPADMDIRYVVRLMVNANIRRAPVEHHGEYIGMISLNSLIMDQELM